MRASLMTPFREAHLLAEAQRHESAARRLRSLAANGDLLDEEALTTPIVHGWQWDVALSPAVRGAWLPLEPGARGIVDGRVGPIIAHVPDMSAILTLDGWYLLGVPGDASDLQTGTVQ